MIILGIVRYPESQCLAEDIRINFRASRPKRKSRSNALPATSREIIDASTHHQKLQQQHQLSEQQITRHPTQQRECQQINHRSINPTHHSTVTRACLTDNDSGKQISFDVTSTPSTPSLEGLRFALRYATLAVDPWCNWPHEV